MAVSRQEEAGVVLGELLVEPLHAPLLLGEIAQKDADSIDQRLGVRRLLRIWNPDDELDHRKLRWKELREGEEEFECTRRKRLVVGVVRCRGVLPDRDDLVEHPRVRDAGAAGDLFPGQEGVGGGLQDACARLEQVLKCTDGVSDVDRLGWRLLQVVEGDAGDGGGEIDIEVIHGDSCVSSVVYTFRLVPPWDQKRVHP